MNTPTLGIDIAKLKFDVSLMTASAKPRHKAFPNTPTGFAQLAEWLAAQSAGRAHACLEATGTYGRALALFLHGAGHTVSVVNPAVIKAYGASKLSRTKTDRSDATLIAHYCLTQRPAAWAPPAPEVRELHNARRKES